MATNKRAYTEGKPGELISASGVIEVPVPYCTVCEKDMWSLKRCARCQLVGYCSKSCQTNDWDGGHKIKCKEYRTRLAALQTEDEWPADFEMIIRASRIIPCPSACTKVLCKLNRLIYGSDITRAAEALRLLSNRATTGRFIIRVWSDRFAISVHSAPTTKAERARGVPRTHMGSFIYVEPDTSLGGYCSVWEFIQQFRGQQADMVMFFSSQPHTPETEAAMGFMRLLHE